MPNRNLLDFSKYKPSWLQDEEDELEAMGTPQALIDRMERETGKSMTAEEKQQLTDDMISGMTFDNAVGKRGPKTTEKSKLDFSTYKPSWVDEIPDREVKEEVAAPVIPVKAEEKGFWAGRADAVGRDLEEIGQIGSTLLGGGQRATGAAAYNAGRSSNPLVTATMKLGAVMDALGSGDMGAAIKEVTSDSTGIGERIAADLHKRAEPNAAEGEKLRATLEDRDWLSRELGGGIIDAAGSPTSALSLIGGPAGAVVMADVYSQSYYQARMKGVPAEQAEAYAILQAGTESISMIPAGKLFERLPILGPILKKRAKAIEEKFLQDSIERKLVDPNIKAATNVVKTMFGEGTEETISGGLQDVVNVVAASQDKAKELQDFTKEQAPLDAKGEVDWGKVADNAKRNFRAGVVMGGPGGVIASIPEYEKAAAAEADRMLKLADVTGAITDDKLTGAANERSLEAQMTQAASVQDLADQNTELAKQEGTDRAYEEDKYSAEQKAAEEEAGFRTSEREKAVAGQTRLDKFPDGMERVPVSPVAEATPEEVQEEWESRKAAEDARFDRVDMGTEAARVRARRKVLADKATAEAAEKADLARKADIKLKSQRSAYENKIRDEILLQNPDMELSKVVTLTSAAIKAAPFVAPVEVAPVVEAPAAGKKKGKKRRTAAAVPTATAAAPVVTETATPSPTPVQAVSKGVAAKAVPAGTQAELDSLASQLGIAPKKAPKEAEADRLAMATPAPKVDPDSYVGKHVRALKALVARRTQTSTDVQNLALQGKLIFAPNPKSLNHKDTNAAAEYDVKDGKMYVYLDNMNPDDVGGMLVRALHESGHLIDFNEREGRGDVFDSMMTKGGSARASAIIRKAAEGGNKIAQKAVANAVKASELKDEDGNVTGYSKRLEELELVPYFVGEVAGKREGTVLGSVGGVARDIRKAGRDFLRKGLGMDLDLTMNDLHVASMGVAGEAVKTTVKGQESDVGTLEMIGGQQGTGFDDADYIYAGKVDGKLRYEFSDAAARFVSDSSAGYADLLNGRTVRLSDILIHDKLIKNYPDAANIKVKMGPENGESKSMGSFDAARNTITLNPDGALDRTEMLNTVLHEVQHWVQAKEGFVPGANNDALVSNVAKREKEDAEAKYNNFLTTFELGTAVRSLPPHIRETWEKQLAQRKQHTFAPSQVQVVKWFLEQNYASSSTNRFIQKYNEEFFTLRDAKDDALENLTKAEKEALALYKRDYGETEARNTEFRRMMSDEQREAFPPEDSMYHAEYGIRAQDTIDTSKLRPGQMSKEEPITRLAMAGDGSGRVVDITDTPNFKRWFRNSRVISTGGRPRIMYHGTATSADFEAFRTTFKDLGMHFGTRAQANHPRFITPMGMDWRNQGAGSRVIPVYLSIQKALRMPDVFGSPTGETFIEGLLATKQLPADKVNALRQYLPVYSKSGGAIKYGDKGMLYIEAVKIMKKAGFDGITYENRGEPEYQELAEDGYTVLDESYEESYIVFDPEQIKSALGNNGDFDPKNPSYLKMTNPALGPELPFTRKIPPVISAFLSSSAGAGKVAREIVEHAVASPAGQRMLGEQTVGQYRDGIAEIAAERGVSEATINKEISEKLDAIDKREDDYEVNLEAFKEVARQYGKAGEALITFRNQVDDLSFQMIRGRVAQGTPLTAKEVETYTTIHNNMGRYSHRQYAVHMGKGGKKFAQTIMEDYRKFLKTKGVNASQRLIDNHKRVADAVKKIVDENLVIPSDEVLMELTTTEVKRLFDIWGAKTNSDAYSLSQQRSILSDMRDAVNSNSDVMTATAEALVHQIIGLAAPKSPLAQSFRGGKIDQSILKERSWLSPEIRKLMGEIEDPAMRLFSTVAKQTEFIARSRMLQELRDNVGPEHLQPPGAMGRPEVAGMVQLTGEEYGALQSHYVSENLANLLSSHIQTLATFEQAVAMAITRPTALGTLAATSGMQLWGNIAGKTKMLQIVYKPVNFVANFMGGPRTLMINGNLNPKHTLKAMKTAMHIIAYSLDPSKSSAEARRVTSLGVTDSAFVGEINAEVYAELNKTLKEMQGKPESDAMELLRKSALFAKEGYAMMDVVYKIANFYHQADAVLPAFYNAGGTTEKGATSPTQEQIDREAADIINGTNVTYKRAAPIVKNAERYGITQFATFFYEVFRTEVNNVRQGVAELRRGKAAPNSKAAGVMYMQGSKRLIGQLTAWGATGYLSHMLASMVFGDDDDREEKLRAMLPDYLRNQDFVIFGKDKDGKGVLYDWSRVDPAGPITDLMRTAINQDGDIDKLAMDILKLYVAPRIGSRLLEATGQTTGLLDGKVADPLVKELFPDTFESLLESTYKMGADDSTVKAWARVGETFLPGIAGSWSKSNARPVMEDTTSTLAAIATYGGARMYTLDNPRALNTAAYDHGGTLKVNRSDINSFFNERPNTTTEDLLERLGDLRGKEKASFDALQLTYGGMLAVGHSRKEVHELLKGKKISKDIIKDLQREQFQFRSVSKKSIEGFKKNELVGKTLAEKREIQAKWKKAAELLRVAEDQMDEEN